MVVGILAAAACFALMALFIFGSWWYFKRIRDGRADPVINPSWTTNMRPASPPPPLNDPNDRRRDPL
jgi:hypothetical protein